MKESLPARKKRVLKVIRRLRKAYPEIRCPIHFSNPWELLVATILSAQCTDQRVNMVTPALFRSYARVHDYAVARPGDLERLIRSTGFFRNKARNIIGAARAVCERFTGRVPSTLEELVTLPGVGRKTANVVLGNAFGVPSISVDTHMIRLNRRLGFTVHADPVKIEFDLRKVVPEKCWTEFSGLIIRHGRVRCFARKPDCAGCEISGLCPSAFLKV